MLYIVKLMRMKRGLNNYAKFNQLIKDIYNRFLIKRTIAQYTFDVNILNNKKLNTELIDLDQ